eukprot:10266-Heterococcus_DN1.PRE.3
MSAPRTTAIKRSLDVTDAVVPAGADKRPRQDVKVKAEVKPEAELSSPWAAGAVMSVEMKHFMCHEHAIITLIPGINFLQGPSSSGKSAVLAAIKLCLSKKEIAKPELIRHPWAGSGEVAVKLHNTAQDGFMYNAYGASHFSLNPWNPCMIVDAPSFDRLLRGDAVERYKYFMEATDVVSAKLITIILQCRNRKLSLEDDAIDLQGLTEVAAKESATMSHLQYTVQQLRKRYGLYTAVTDKQREMTRLSAQLAWAELAAAEADVTAAQQQLAEFAAALQRAEAARTEHAQSVTAKTQEREALCRGPPDSVRAPIAAENKPLRLQLEALAQRASAAAAAAQRGAVPQLQFVEANIASLQTVMADSAEQRHARQQLLFTAQAQCTTAAQQLRDAVKGAATAATAHRKCRSA